jgi:hypothetical protein
MLILLFLWLTLQPCIYSPYMELTAKSARLAAYRRTSQPQSGYG